MRRTVRTGALAVLCTVLTTAVTSTLPASPAGAAAPAVVHVQVAPALAGVQVAVEGVQGVTDARGTVDLTVGDPSLAAGQLTLPDQQLSPDLRVSLDRVLDVPYEAGYAHALVAELDVDRLVSFRFLTPRQAVLPNGRVSTMTMTDNLGRTTVWTGTQLSSPVWLASSRPTRVAGGIKARVVAYAVQSVLIDGVNVVHRGQTRFTSGDPSPWDVPVGLYTLTITGNDFISGASVGRTAKVTYPDKRTTVVRLGAHHSVVVPDLPGGDYRVSVSGGVVPISTTVHLSGTDHVAAIVVTASDMAELIAVGVVLLAVLVAAGVVGRRMRKRRALSLLQDGVEPHAT